MSYDDQTLAVAQLTGEAPGEVSQTGTDYWSVGSVEYLVLTDGDADESARDDIEQSLWAFNAGWISDYLPEGVGYEVIEALQPQCEGANEAIRSMVGERFDDLVEAAIATDGRGHFLGRYDGEEHEVEINGTTYFLYRV